MYLFIYVTPFENFITLFAVHVSNLSLFCNFFVNLHKEMRVRFPQENTQRLGSGEADALFQHNNNQAR